MISTYPCQAPKLGWAQQPSPRKLVLVAAAATPNSKVSSNGAGPHKMAQVTPTVDQINFSLAACILEASVVGPLERANKDIGKEIMKAASTRFRQR